MNKTTYLLAATAALTIGTGAISSAKAEDGLFIYNWSDYTAPELIRKFEKETGIKVTLDTFDSNETLLAKMKSSAAGYDIVVLNSDFVEIFVKQGLISKVDASKLRGFSNIAPRWRGPAWDRNNDYTIPYVWGVTAFSVNTKYLKEQTPSLRMLFSPPGEARGKVGMLGSPSEVISLAELYLGMPPCQTDLANMKKVSELLEAQAPAVKVYNTDGVIDRMSSSEVWLSQAWNGDTARARANNPDVKFVFPNEGVTGWMDNVAVPAGARHPENARRFMEFLLQPENAALTSNFTHYSNALPASSPFLDASLRTSTELNIPENLKIVFNPACSEEAIKLMDRVWTRLKH